MLHIVEDTSLEQWLRVKSGLTLFLHAKASFGSICHMSPAVSLFPQVKKPAKRWRLRYKGYKVRKRGLPYAGTALRIRPMTNDLKLLLIGLYCNFAARDSSMGRQTKKIEI